jgi:hypothetical protein
LFNGNKARGEQIVNLENERNQLQATVDNLQEAQIRFEQETGILREKRENSN